MEDNISFIKIHNLLVPAVLLQLCFSVLLNRTDAQDLQQITKVTPNVRSASDRFGFSTAIDGDYAMIGAHLEDEDASDGSFVLNAGAAYIFKRSFCKWNPIQKLVASDRDEDDQFGSQVAMLGDYAFVSTYLEDEDENGDNPILDAGAVYVFKNNNGIWVQTQKLVAPDRSEEDFFGYSLSVSGDYLVVGAYREDEDANGLNTLFSAGSAYVYKNENGTWNFMQKIVPNDRGIVEQFGFSVSIKDDLIAVGAYQDREDENEQNPMNASGSVYLFYFNGIQWDQIQKICSPERTPGNNFGYNIQISENELFVGVPREARDITGSNPMPFTGAVYRFEKISGTWVFAQKMIASDRNLLDFFGNTIALDGNNLLVSAYREDEDSTGNNSLADAGSAYLFVKRNGVWTENQKICSADRQTEDFFSLRLSISGDYAIIGSSLDDEDDSGSNTIQNAGSAYFFRFTNGKPCDPFDACAAIESLIETIHYSNINPSIKNSLIVKLQSAKSSFQNGNANAAINKLNAFINEVQAQSGKKISTELATNWIEIALQIIHQIDTGEAICEEGNESMIFSKEIRPLNAVFQTTSIHVRQNPASNDMNIEVNLLELSSLFLIDAVGKIIYQKDLPSGIHSIELNEFKKLGISTGYYYLNLVSTSHSVNTIIFISK